MSNDLWAFLFEWACERGTRSFDYGYGYGVMWFRISDGPYHAQAAVTREQIEQGGEALLVYRARELMRAIAKEKARTK